MSESRTPVKRLDSLLAGLEDEVLTSEAEKDVSAERLATMRSEVETLIGASVDRAGGTGAGAGCGRAHCGSEGAGGPGNGEARELDRGDRARRRAGHVAAVADGVSRGIGPRRKGRARAAMPGRGTPCRMTNAARAADDRRRGCPGERCGARRR